MYKLISESVTVLIFDVSLIELGKVKEPNEVEIPVLKQNCTTFEVVTILSLNTRRMQTLNFRYK